MKLYIGKNCPSPGNRLEEYSVIKFRNNKACLVIKTLDEEMNTYLTRKTAIYLVNLSSAKQS